MVQIASEVLGIPMDNIALVCADSELTPQDPGNYPMLAAFCPGNAVRLAALDARQQILEHDNVLIHVIEHDIVATLDILYEHKKSRKWSDVLNV